MKQRFDFLDNLRTYLTVLVVVFHASIAYGAAGSWILEDVDRSKITVTIVLLTIFTAVCQSFFMGLFFFISAFFTPGSYDRKGPALFLKDRLIRLGIPLAAYYFVIGPVTEWFALFRDAMTLGQFYRTHVWNLKWTFFGPAWFLEASIYFALLYALYRVITGKFKIERWSIPFPGGRTLWITAVLLGLAAFAVRFLYPIGTGVLELQLGYFPSYILLFMAGIAAYRNGWLQDIPGKLKNVWIRIAVASIPVLPIGLIATGALDGNLEYAGGASIQAFLYAMWEPFVCIGIILWLLSWFRHKFNASGRFRKWLSGNTYAVYLIHPPVVVGWTIVFHGVFIPAIVKWVIVSALSVAVCFLLAGAIRAVPGVKRIL